MSERFQQGDTLLVVDAQRDFFPGGALAVPEGDAILPVLNRWAASARDAHVPVFASRDWHPPGHASFSTQGGTWPEHCVQQTGGAEFHPDLNLPKGTIIISKGTDPDRDSYSAFDGTGLAARLREAGVRRLWMGGLAFDVCVRASVLDAIREGFEVRLIRPATRAVNVQPDDGEKALEEMRSAGAVIEEASEP
ncbi:MAG: nicotinamidase [Planctomycetota bacterium]|nr:nicotinamidase [Planctomycetota bacterium]